MARAVFIARRESFCIRARRLSRQKGGLFVVCVIALLYFLFVSKISITFEIYLALNSFLIIYSATRVLIAY